MSKRKKERESERKKEKGRDRKRGSVEVEKKIVSLTGKRKQAFGMK